VDEARRLIYLADDITLWARRAVFTGVPVVFLLVRH
jgi:hypothetical protein